MVVIIRDSAYLATSTYGKFFKHPDFVDEKIHQTQFVTESNQNIKTRRMKGNTVAFFLKFSGQLQRAKAREHIYIYIYMYSRVYSHFLTQAITILRIK